MKRTVLASILLVGTMGATTMAQPPANAPMPPPGQGPRPAEMQAQRRADYVLLLGLRPDQQTKLDAMLQAAMPRGPRFDGRGAPGGPDRPPLEQSAIPFPERLAQMEKQAAQHAEAERNRIATLRAFYEALDAGQRQRFEALTRLSRGPGGGFRPDFGPPPPPRDQEGPGEGRGPGRF
jgi:hypothetical protein